MNKSNKLQNKISHLFLAGSDLAKREEEILRDVSNITGFIPEKLMDKSTWWTSKEIGAFRYEGQFKGKKAVLKIQGVKPATSEIYMIDSFAKANKSNIIRPPVLYDSMPWDDKKRYEALIMEFINGKRIVSNLTNSKELERFFFFHQEYGKNCTTKPWLDKPKFNLSEEIKENFSKWRLASFKLYLAHPLREDADKELIDDAVDLLQKEYQGVGSQFQHGHFSTNDLSEISENNVVLLSNLYWSFRPPFYDLVFGYHWFMYKLAEIENLSPQDVDTQRVLWLSKINEFARSDEEKRLLSLALLERAAAGLNLDALSIDIKNPISAYLIEETRKEIKRLLGLIKKVY